MTRWVDYHTPRTVEAALQTLEAHPSSAIIAGGTDLLLDLEQGRHPYVSNLVDISRVEELHRHDLGDGYMVIGSAVPLSKLLEHQQLHEHAPGLIEACKLIGGPQVRNVATLGGNVGHALPAGDGTIALLSLGAEAHLVSQEADDWVPLPELFTGPGQVSYDRGRVLITALRFNLREKGEGSAFRRVMRPQGVAIAIMNMGVWLRCDVEGRIADARITLGPGGPTPFLANGGSKALVSQTPDEAVLRNVADAILEEARFRTSRHRSTKAYREHLVSALLQQTVHAAYERACSYHSLEVS
jgi:carbon-monoxide dehydrogenase medium subunit